MDQAETDEPEKLNWLERVTFNRQHKRARKRLELIKNILPVANNKLAEMHAQRAIEQNEKKQRKYDKEIERLQNLLLSYKKGCIESIVAASELFEIEDETGTTVTREYLETLSIEELLEQLETINNALAKITS